MFVIAERKCWFVENLLSLLVTSQVKSSEVKRSEVSGQTEKLFVGDGDSSLGVEIPPLVSR